MEHEILVEQRIQKEKRGPGGPLLSNFGTNSLIQGMKNFTKFDKQKPSGCKLK
jgi:hypothetical protein